MFTQVYRPTNFREIRGQSIPVQVMLRTVQNPSEAPRVYILHGQFGTGKTSLARIVAHALNCRHPRKGEPCGVCDNCKADIEGSPFYREFDCGAFGSADDIRQIREDIILNSSLSRYQVVVLDEFHVASKQAQSSLLKILEEIRSNTFVLICTTDMDRVIETLKSRAINLHFNLVSAEDIYKALKEISLKESIQVTDDTLNTIAALSGGHTRDAVMNLELVRFIGEEQFRANIPRTEENIIHLLTSLRTGDLDDFEVRIHALLESPLVRVKTEFYSVLKNGIKYLTLGYTDTKAYSQEYSEMTKAWGYDIIHLFQHCLSNWAVNAFTTDVCMQTFFRSLWATFHSR